MNQNWNFYGYIAVPLETYGRNLVGESFYSADEIEHGEFVSAMLQYISIKFNGLQEFAEFCSMCSEYDGVSANEIPENVAKDIFKEFMRIKNF